MTNDDTTVTLGTGIEVDGYVFTEAKIKIVGGMSEYAIPDPPRRGNCRTYVVKAECTRYLIDEKGEEPRLIIEMAHYVVYDRDQGPLNDRQRAETPAEIEALDRKSKEVTDSDDDIDENQPGLFGEGPDADQGDGEPDGDAEMPQGPEWNDAEAQAPAGDDAAPAEEHVRPSFSSIEGGRS